MNEVKHVKWCMKQTKLTSEISCPEDPEVLVSNPTGGNFWRFFFCSSLCEDLSDNLTATSIVKNSISQSWIINKSHQCIHAGEKIDHFKQCLLYLHNYLITVFIIISTHLPLVYHVKNFPYQTHYSKLDYRSHQRVGEKIDNFKQSLLSVYSSENTYIIR